jgi:CheY-like chemotaxis protein
MMKPESIPVMKNIPGPLESSFTQQNTDRKPVVLIAEADESSCELLKMMLSRKGCIVVEADLSNVIQVAEKFQPNLILLNIGRPFQAGLDILKQMYQHDLMRRLPTIVTSANASADFRNEVLATGYSQMLVKPLDFDLLERLIVLNFYPQKIALCSPLPSS